ncbi:MAG: hypothetical protein LBH25_04130 [Fibromonadaceae bacterium]|jgi:hypothetical protein|nr:hypothetical protein [Fibromonadaceae bacterium]
MRAKLSNKGVCNSLLLAAILVFALAFTISCSSGDDNEGGSGGRISDLPAQLFYRDGGKFNDNADIMLYFVAGSGPFPAGKIQNGKIAWDLPKSIDNKYLINFNECNSCEEYHSPPPPGFACIDKLNSTKDIYSVSGNFYFNTLEKGNCELRLMAESARVDIVYFSKSGEITGTIERAVELGPTVIWTYDMNFLSGWSILYNVETSESKRSVSTNKSVLKGKALKWVASYCDEDALQ